MKRAEYFGHRVVVPRYFPGLKHSLEAFLLTIAGGEAVNAQMDHRDEDAVTNVSLKLQNLPWQSVSSFSSLWSPVIRNAQTYLQEHAMIL